MIPSNDRRSKLVHLFEPDKLSIGKRRDLAPDYAQKDQAETSVFFELIARRYETRSLAIAANQPFSAWDRIFPDQAVTVAAIDRLVHHDHPRDERRQLPTPRRRRPNRRSG